MKIFHPEPPETIYNWEKKNRAKNATWNSTRPMLVKMTSVSNPVESLGYIISYSLISPRPVKSPSNFTRCNCQKTCSFFNCNLAAPHPTLGHCRGGSLTNLVLITALVPWFGLKVTWSLTTSLGLKACLRIWLGDLASIIQEILLLWKEKLDHI